VLLIEFTKATPVTATAPKVARRMPVSSADGATRVEFELTLPAMKNNKSEFQVNGAPFWKAKPYSGALGETQLWIVMNESDWDHPFHLHGFFFQVLDEQNQPVRPLALKDTVNVPMNSTVRLLVHFDERPGEWMFHCHILDHADGGLMGTVLIGAGGSPGHVHKQQ